MPGRHHGLVQSQGLVLGAIEQLGIKGHQTTNEIAQEFGVHPTQVNTWKKQLLESSSDVFGKGKQKREADFENERETLYSQIGRLKVEVDWLKKRPDISTERCRKGSHD